MFITSKVLVAGIVTLILYSGAVASETAHWSYEGHGGPDHWGELNHDYTMCKDGKQQSPIDISKTTGLKLPPILLSYKATAKNIVNNGHTIQINMNEGSSIKLGDKTYKLLQFHFHSPSEHTINGRHADMVVHLVHKADDGQLGVIGMLLDTGKENSVITTLWKNLPTKTGEERPLPADLDVSRLMPPNMSYYNYSGSLTTPPCSEGVNWMVLRSRGKVSAEQIETFTKLFPKSIRPVQPLNGRVVSGS